MRRPCSRLLGLMRACLLLGVFNGALLVVLATLAQEKPKTLPPPAKKKVDFARDIQPLLKRSCYSCHGNERQEGGLRLHTKKSAFKGGDLGAEIVPGKSAKSRLIQYVSGVNDDDVLMPPEGEGTPLKPQEISLLRAWIDQGAKWPDDGQGSTVKSDHWSFQPIVRASPPKVKDAAWVRNPIDSFVLANLEEHNVRPSPEADRATLLRRLSLDLLGLPPTPRQLVAFLSDRRPGAYDRLVDRLLASPAYGERWGRHWLDLARYADSDGYEKDRQRPHAWRFRQWVISALNEDMPFDQFTLEQLAGDLLSDPTTEQLVATGFHRNTLTNTEGGTDKEEDRVKQTIDRLNTTGTVWLGLTVECGQCHSHKYDPLSQQEFYGLYAFFNSLQEVNIPAPLDPKDEIAYQRVKQAFDKEQAKLKAVVAAYVKQQLPAKQAQWEKQLAGKIVRPWRVLTPEKVASKNGAKLTIQKDGSVLASGANPATDTVTVLVETDLEAITGLRLEALADDSLPAKGPGRVKHGNFVLSEIHLSAAPRNAPRNGEAASANIPLQNATADFSQGKDMKEWPVAAAIDGDVKTGWAIASQFGKNHVAVFETSSDAGFPGGTRLTITLDQQYGSQHTLGRFRISVTDMPRPVRIGGFPDNIASILATLKEKRTKKQLADLTVYYRTVDAELAKLESEAAAHAKKAPKRKDGSMAQTLAELSTPRTTRLLLRGDFLQPGEEVQLGTPEVFPPLEAEGERASRVDLARWLLSDDHPLTARVTVNRLWQHYYGRGIVETSHDFGTQGSPPSHPKLLDWLASEFRSSGWAVKAMHRLIVTSATYRQQSASRPELAEADPYNKWLSHQNRLRVEAEVVRDIALAASGLLEPQVGGPSVRPPQSADIAALGYAGSVKWSTSKGADRYRRGLYTFFQRTVPYPMFMDFDAPESNTTCAKRERSNTPLAALTLQNDPVFAECAQAFSRRMVRERGGAADRASQVEHAFRVCLSRNPDAEERAAIAGLFEAALRQFEADPKSAAALAGALPKPEGASDAEFAAWTVIGRTLMNLDEFITRE